MFAVKACRAQAASQCRPLLCTAPALPLPRHIHIPNIKRPTALTINNNKNHRTPSITPRHGRPFLTSLPSLLVPPIVFTSLFIALWTYKILMTIIFQEKILYMSYMPPQTRSEVIEDYAATCKPIEWEEVRIKSLDGTKIALAVGSMDPAMISEEPVREIVICYFQGNGGSVPPRLPLLSNTLKALHQSSVGQRVRFTIIALSYRGYWTSSGRATEAGIKLDAQATLRWIKETHPNATIVLWGQSLGAGVACAAAAQHLSKLGGQTLQGLILETPFTSVSSMLKALYPEKWLPYRYLSGFLRSHWDSRVALKRISMAEGGRKPRILLIAATRDEVVPPEEAESLQRVCEEAELGLKRVNVIGALHNEATTRREGQEAIARFVVDVCGLGKAL
jgi:fermentation-respiration switch protein FrsA (DUF1100 family)